MATTVLQSFNEFKSNLEISDKQVNLVSTRRTNLVSSLKQKLSLHPSESLLIGSYDRNTMIRPLAESDVDVLVILHYGDNKEWNNPDGTVKALDRFKDILDNAYPLTTKRRDRNCISIKYSEFTMDVVPGFKYDEGYYTIPDTIRRDWIKTDPIGFASSQSNINSTMEKMYIPLIKMVKAWNRKNGHLLRCFHLECIMHSRYRSYTQGYSYSSMIKVFFEELSDYITHASFDPITGDRVDSYLDNGATTTNRQIAVSLAKKGAEIAAQAYNQENDNPPEAIKAWKQLFGDYFPSYG